MIADSEDEALEFMDDLGEVVRELRAYLQWQQVVGATGLPRDPRPAQSFRSAERDLPTPPPTADVNVPEPLAPLQPIAARAPVEPTPAPVERRVRHDLPVLSDDLNGLAAAVKTCTRCELHQGRKQAVFARGTGSSGLCFVGEGPGADEDEQGFPFVGAAGQLLDKMISAMGFGRDEVYVCNIVKCRPPNNRKPSDEEMHACHPFLERQLALIKPRVIVALGATAVTGLIRETRGITKIRGTFRLYDGRIALMPTFHPAYLLRNPAAKRDVWNDLRKVVEHMGRSLPNSH